MKITSLKPMSRDPCRCVVRGEGGWRVTLSVEAVAELGLSVGQVCDERLKGAAQAAADRQSVMQQAMRVIRRRAIGSKQLAERLTRKGLDAGLVRGVIDDLLQRGLLDDEAYARAAASTLRARKATGSRLLRQKLYQKRLPRDVIESVVAEVEKEADPLAEARALAEKKLRGPTLRRCDAVTRKRRLWGLLARRGFDSGVIQKALSDLEINEE